MPRRANTRRGAGARIHLAPRKNVRESLAGDAYGTRKPEAPSAAAAGVRWRERAYYAAAAAVVFVVAVAVAAAGAAGALPHVQLAWFTPSSVLADARALEPLGDKQVAVRPSGIQGAGLGAFARRAFKRGEKIGDYRCVVKEWSAYLCVPRLRFVLPAASASGGEGVHHGHGMPDQR